jgi:hypothetical protein
MHTRFAKFINLQELRVLDARLAVTGRSPFRRALIKPKFRKPIPVNPDTSISCVPNGGFLLTTKRRGDDLFQTFYACIVLDLKDFVHQQECLHLLP